jgi:hypothetical protein
MDLEYTIDPDDREELSKMPLCAEKVLIELALDLCQTDNDENKLINDFNKLEERLKTEGLYSYESIRICKSLKNFISQKNFDSAVGKLKEILSLIRDLNIPKLLRLTKENTDALEMVRDRNIFLFIGFTGSGN